MVSKTSLISSGCPTVTWTGCEVTNASKENARCTSTGTN